MNSSSVFLAITIAPLVLFLGVIAFGVIRKNKYNHKGWSERTAEAIKSKDLRSYWELAQAKRLLLSLALPWGMNIIAHSYGQVVLSANGQPTFASNLLLTVTLAVALFSLFLFGSAIYQLVIGWKQASETKYAQYLQNNLERLHDRDLNSPFGENGTRKTK